MRLGAWIHCFEAHDVIILRSVELKMAKVKVGNSFKMLYMTSFDTSVRCNHQTIERKHRNMVKLQSGGVDHTQLAPFSRDLR